MIEFTPLEIVSMLAFFAMYAMNAKLVRKLHRAEEFNNFQKNVIVDIALGNVTVTRQGDMIKLELKESTDGTCNSR